MHYSASPASTVARMLVKARACMPTHLQPHVFAPYSRANTPLFCSFHFLPRLCSASVESFIAGSMSSPAGEGVQRDSGAFFIPPLGLCSIAQFFFFFFSALPPNLQECFCGSIADELTLQKCLTQLLMASSWNVWQIRLLPVDIWCSKNCPTRGCLLTLSPRWVEMCLFFFPALCVFHLLFRDLLLKVVCPWIRQLPSSQTVSTLAICLRLPSLPSRHALSPRLRRALALTPKPFTWASSPVLAQIEFDTAVSQLQFNLGSLLCRGPSEAILTSMWMSALKNFCQVRP